MMHSQKGTTRLIVLFGLLGFLVWLLLAQLLWWALLPLKSGPELQPSWVPSEAESASKVKELTQQNK